MKGSCAGNILGKQHSFDFLVRLIRLVRREKAGYTQEVVIQGSLFGAVACDRSYRWFPPFRPSLSSLGLLLRRSLGLGGLLLVAVDHHDAYEGAHHSRAQESQDDGDADGPNTRGEEVVERVAGVDEGLNKGKWVSANRR